MSLIIRLPDCSTMAPLRTKSIHDSNLLSSSPKYQLRYRSTAPGRRMVGADPVGHIRTRRLYPSAAAPSPPKLQVSRERIWPPSHDHSGQSNMDRIFESASRMSAFHVVRSAKGCHHCAPGKQFLARHSQAAQKVKNCDVVITAKICLPHVLIGNHKAHDIKFIVRSSTVWYLHISCATAVYSIQEKKPLQA